MIRPHCVNSINFFVECRRLVNDELEKVVGSGLPGKKLELFIYRPAPCNDDSAGDLAHQSTVKLRRPACKSVYAQ